MKPVEYLVAYDDNTWDTHVEPNVPDEYWGDEAQAVAWANANLMCQPRFRKAVMMAVYHFPEEDEVDCFRDDEDGYPDFGDFGDED